MNVKLLNEVKAAIAEEPRRLSMFDWLMPVTCGSKIEIITNPDGGYTDVIAPPCGTIGCIAGWATALSQKEVEPKKLANQRDPAIIQNAAKLLELNDAKKWRLFYPSRWPAKFRSKLYGARTPGGRAKATIARINHFIKTNGVE